MKIKLKGWLKRSGMILDLVAKLLAVIKVIKDLLGYRLMPS
ncbi:MAG TPA: hypothetical protein VJJ80_02930 [Patescibacteria group bacterium]|nr:hypothetical protein [Patescibacteria group bacterium]